MEQLRRDSTAPTPIRHSQHWGSPLYTGGSLIAQKKIAKADEELDRLAIELTLDQIHYQSDAVYWNASAAYASLEAAARFEEIINQQYNIILDRFNDGAISRTDLLMISTRKKEAELQYIKARQNHTLALQQLNILMGAKPNAPVDSLSEISIASDPVDILGLDDVLPRRADYASTNSKHCPSEAQRKAALSKYNPQLSMFLATGWDTGITYMGQDVPHTPIAGLNRQHSPFSGGEPASRQTDNRKHSLASRSYNKAILLIISWKSSPPPLPN